MVTIWQVSDAVRGVLQVLSVQIFPLLKAQT